MSVVVVPVSLFMTMTMMSLVLCIPPWKKKKQVNVWLLILQRGERTSAWWADDAADVGAAATAARSTTDLARSEAIFEVYARYLNGKRPRKVLSYGAALKWGERGGGGRERQGESERGRARGRLLRLVFVAVCALFFFISLFVGG